MGTLAVPVVGVAAAWLQLGEMPVVVEAAGMVLIIAALALLAAAGMTSRRAAGAGDDEPLLLPVVDRALVADPRAAAFR
jgi:hypothetical protein